MTPHGDIDSPNGNAKEPTAGVYNTAASDRIPLRKLRGISLTPAVDATSSVDLRETWSASEITHASKSNNILLFSIFSNR